MDVVSREKRSEIMRAIKGKNTKPEIAIRKLLHGLGYRFRLHRKDLPGSPDIVFVSRKKVVFVHGCFWHGHACKRNRVPASNRAYWMEKIARNKRRDARVKRALTHLGWAHHTVWECGLKKPALLALRLRRFLDPQ
jgi:DNA mismatch endonuclease (patch repair protein)